MYREQVRFCTKHSYTKYNQKHSCLMDVTHHIMHIQNALQWLQGVVGVSFNI